MLRKACIAGAQRGLSAVNHLDLAKDLRYVVAHRLGAEYQALGDRQVGMPLSNKDEDFALALRQGREYLKVGRWLRCREAK